jgi:hypothetical protein
MDKDRNTVFTIILDKDRNTVFTIIWGIGKGIASGGLHHRDGDLAPGLLQTSFRNEGREFQNYFRPSRSEEHLGVTCTPVKMVQKCKPLPQPLPHVLIQKVCPWVQCFVCPAHTVVK